jgi:membrane-bound inhibitor of C-type lysozyme
MTFKKVVFYIAIIALLGIVGYQLMNTEKPEVLPIIEPVVTAPVITSTSQYFCDTGSTIIAGYSEKMASLKLSDGRSIDLPQVVSADGARYAKDSLVFVTKGDQAFLQENGTDTYTNCISDSSNGVAVNGMKTFTDQGNTFSFSYPEAFTLAGGGIGYSENWKVNTDGALGLVLASVKTPEDYQPKTNFGDARFTVGTSSDPKAVKECLMDNSGQGVVKTKVTLNKIPYTKFVSVDAGAGNRYETNSFRTVQNGQCYAIEYTIHYAVLENFDPKSGTKAFDQKKVHDVLDGIVASLTFLQQ